MSTWLLLQRGVGCRAHYGCDKSGLLPQRLVYLFCALQFDATDCAYAINGRITVTGMRLLVPMLGTAESFALSSL